MKLLYELFHNQKLFFFSAILCSIGSIIITLLWNSELALMIQLSELNNSSFHGRITYCILLLFTGALFQGGTVLFSSYAGEFAIHDLRMGMADSYLKQNYTTSNTVSTGEQLSLQTQELEEIKQYISEHLFPLLTDCIHFIFTLAFLLSQNTLLTILCNLPVLVLLLYTTLSSKIIYNYTIKEQAHLQKMNSISQTALSLFPILRIYDAGQLLLERYSESIHSWQKSLIIQESVKAKLMSVSGMISTLPLLLLLLIGGTMVINKSFPMGTLYIFINLSGNVSGIMTNMPGHLANYRKFCGCIDRVWQSAKKTGEQ